MRTKFTALLPAALLVGALTGPTRAIPTVTVTDPGGTLSSVNVILGNSTSVTIWVATDISLTSGQFFLNLAVSGTGILTLNSVTWENNTIWDTALSSVVDSGNQPVPSPGNPNLGNGGFFDIFRGAVNLITGTGTLPSPPNPGGRFVTLDFTPSAVGTYTLTTSGYVFSDINFDDVGGQSGGGYTIVVTSSQQQIIPAPGAAVLAFLGLNIVGYVKRPRRRDLEAPAA